MLTLAWQITTVEELLWPEIAKIPKFLGFFQCIAG
jgi:hypothetical protein